MVTAEEVKIKTSEIWLLYTVALFASSNGLFCVPSCRKGVVRRVSAIGLAWALATTLLHTGDLRSPRASAQTLGAYATTGLKIKHLLTGQERTVWHLQYTDWPDHGCPEDFKGFLCKYNTDTGLSLCQTILLLALQKK